VQTPRGLPPRRPARRVGRLRHHLDHPANLRELRRDEAPLIGPADSHTDEHIYPYADTRSASTESGMLPAVDIGAGMGRSGADHSPCQGTPTARRRIPALVGGNGLAVRFSVNFRARRPRTGTGELVVLS
jgi:hypothetical protein